MNRPEPRFRGGPGQREVQEKAAKLRAAAADAPFKGEPPRKGASSSGSKSGLSRGILREAAGPEAVRPKNFTEKGGARRSPKQFVPDRDSEGAVSRGEFSKSGRRVPLTTVKNIIGLFLIPVAWVWTISFAGVFSKATVHQRFWMTEDFWCFMLGVVAWLVAFTGGLYLRGEPPLLRTYVRVHEYTHAIWTWLSNGRSASSPALRLRQVAYAAARRRWPASDVVER